MRNFLKLTVILLLLPSCALIPTKTTITMPNEEVYVVKSKSDALVVLKQGDTEMTVDNRGKPTLIEQLSVLIFGSIPKEVSVD